MGWFHICPENQHEELKGPRFAESTLERDHFKGPEESKEFGLIDEIVSKRNIQQQASGLWT